MKVLNRTEYYACDYFYNNMEYITHGSVFFIKNDSFLNEPASCEGTDCNFTTIVIVSRSVIISICEN